VVEARAFWVTIPGAGEIRSEVLAEPGPSEVQVRTSYSAVSRGTEALVFLGRVPESQRQRMRAPHQAGEFPGPVKYGYSSVGRVVAGDPALAGREVFCLYPHQTEYVVPSASVVVLPEGVPPGRAVLAANLETAVNALWDARPLIGDRISVVGGGVVGALVTFLAARVLGTEVELVDIDRTKSALASAFGAAFAVPSEARAERDIVFHASASEEGLSLALGIARADASVIELSWYGDRSIRLDLGGAFHVKRLGLRSSQVGSVSPHARPRFSHRERLSFALSLCRDATLDLLFEEDIAFERLPARMRELASGQALCQRIVYV
jgi:threonine dehydrogenase-like Zn-dependent dehydrogenase